MGKADRALVDVDCSDISSLPLALEATASTHGMDLGVGLKLAAQLSLIPCHARLILLTIDGARRGDLLSVRARQQAPLAAEAALRWCREYVDLWRLQSRLPRTLGKLPV